MHIRQAVIDDASDHICRYIRMGGLVRTNQDYLYTYICIYVRLSSTTPRTTFADIYVWAD